MLDRLTDLVLNRPWLVLAVTLLLSVLAALPLVQLTVTADYKVFFSEDNPELVAYERFEQTYTSNDTALIALQPPEGDIFQNDIIRLLDQLTEASWQLPHVIRVDSPVNFQRIEAEGDDIVIGDLIPEQPGRSPSELDELRRAALSQPLLVGRLLSTDGRTAGILLTFRFPGDDHSEHLENAILAVRALVADFRTTHPDVRFAITGMTPLTLAMDEITLRELSVLLPAMIVALTVMLAVLVRSARAIAATLLVVTLSAAGAMGLAGLAGIQLTTASVAAPIVILTVSVADSIHLISSLLEARRDGMNLREGIAEALRVNGEPIFLTSLTTFIGFLSLNFSDAPPFRDLGNITAAGVVIAWILSMTLLPALLALTGIHEPPARKRKSDWLDTFADIVVINRRPILLIAGLLAVLSVASVPLNRLDDRFLLWFDEDMQVRKDTDFVTDHLTGPYQIEFSLRAADAGSVSDAGYLADVEAFGTWLAQQEGVSHVNSLPDIMKRLNKAMHGGNPDYYTIPDTRELAAQYLLLYEFSLPYGLDLNAQINLDKTASRLTATTYGISSAETRDLKARAEAWIAANAPHIAPTEATGTSVMFSFVSKRTIESMIYGIGFAIVLISLTILISLGSLKIGLLSLLPNVLPVTITFGLWGLLVGEIGIIASTIAAATLGLVVDDTVHFLSKYHRAREEHRLSTHDGIRFAFEHVGRAMMTTTFVLMAGFAVLTFSDFLLNWQMGVLTIMTIATALALDLLLLPALLMWLDREKECQCATCQRAAARGMGETFLAP
ncbi:MAG: MMPL family transporter [Parvibaculaceae bacterium]